MDVYLGIDVGSVSTNVVTLNENNEITHKIYLRTQGRPIPAVQKGLEQILTAAGNHLSVKGVGTTGSGRHLASLVAGADSVKNEITAHAVASSHVVPGVQTVLEIGGQDSKIIIIRNGVAVDFAMNTVCAAGTGSFLDQQASRLDIPIEEFGNLALKSHNAVRIAGRCSVFAESDMIHKQQMGHSLEDIICGLCEALVRNYLNNVGKGKEILGAVTFQGGVAANAGIKAAFEKALGMEVIIPEHFNVMGAVGAALLAKEAVQKKGTTLFKGFEVKDMDYRMKSFECTHCSNQCEVVEMLRNGQSVARWGDRCGKWSTMIS